MSLGENECWSLLGPTGLTKITTQWKPCSAEERGFSRLGGRFQIKMNGCSLNDIGVVRSRTTMKFSHWYNN